VVAKLGNVYRFRQCEEMTSF